MQGASCPSGPAMASGFLGPAPVLGALAWNPRGGESEQFLGIRGSSQAAFRSLPRVPPSSSPTPPPRVTFNYFLIGEEVGVMQTSSWLCHASYVPSGKLLNLSGAQSLHP